MRVRRRSYAGPYPTDLRRLAITGVAMTAVGCSIKLALSISLALALTTLALALALVAVMLVRGGADLGRGWNAISLPLRPRPKLRR